jgi:hypothetical protein
MVLFAFGTAFITVSGFAVHAGVLGALDDSPVVQGQKAQIAPAENPSYTLAVFSDLHVSKSNLKMLAKVAETIKAMDTVNEVAILGDISEEIGNSEERTLAVETVGKFGKPILAIPGNHDVIYANKLKANGKKARASAEVMTSKLKKFADAYDQDDIRFSKKVAGHLLIFLPIDALNARSIAAISGESLDFLEDTLSANKKMPTVIFAHAPLEGSYKVTKDQALSPLHAASQPAERIAGILKKNPQVFMWVAGHRHTKPGSGDFKSKLNKVGKVTVIHVPNVTSGAGWCMMLELYKDKAVMRTYDMAEKKFLTDYRRVFRHATAARTGNEAIKLPEKPLDPPVLPEVKADNDDRDDNSGKDDNVGKAGNADGTIENGLKNTALIKRIKEIQIAIIQLFLNWLKMF